jgi:sarcosine oxidase
VSSDRSDVAVVGAGIMGLAAAHALAREGRDVVVYEQFGPGHDRGSSHGRSRIFRLAYPDPAWVRLAQEALALWRDLEAETGETLLEPTGLLELVERLEDSSAAALEECGAEWQELDPDETARRFPVHVPEGVIVVHQPEAGIVLADRAAAVLAAGLDVRYSTRVASVDELDADVVIVTAGAWVNELVRPPLPVRVTRETVCFFELADPSRPIPAVASFKEGERGHDFYALCDPLHGVKAGAHHSGVEIEAGTAGAPDPELVEAISAWAGARFELARPEPVEAQTCIYTTMPDETFVLERRGRVVVGSACSGHGFKFAPAIGERLAWLATRE